jgi:uncharacterized membrane protein YsdA (DUF1294 family)
MSTYINEGLNGFQLYYILMNSFSFFLFAVDKHRARHKLRRIPEIFLHGTSLFGGGMGSLMGMILLKHKTNKWSFRLLTPLFIFGNLYTYAFLQVLLGL